MKFLSMVALFGLLAFSALAADVTGNWEGSVTSREGNAQEITMNLAQSGNKVTGTVGTLQGDQTIENGQVNGEQISFNVTLKRGERTIKINYTGKVSGNSIQFQRQIEGAPQPVQFTVNRKK